MALLSLEENEKYGGNLSVLEALDTLSEAGFTVDQIMSGGELQLPLNFSNFIDVYKSYKNGEVSRVRFRLKGAYVHDPYVHQLMMYSMPKDSKIEVEGEEVPVSYMLKFWDLEEDGSLDTAVYFSDNCGAENSGKPILAMYVGLMKERLGKRPLKAPAICAV